MVPEEFIIWLNGVFATIGDSQLTKKQSETIKKTLSKVIFDEYKTAEINETDMPAFSIWEASSTAHSSVNKIIVEYTEY